ncbi:cytochrome c [Polynucleobacter paneuropaeus]|jgi:cytochrome c|nr:cytochrome c [Polynucleobacter paneuropaeus]MBT8569442.1 cytochrome c [Polynucleobacter paneuropaeus]QWD20324.1 cytochrome c [Polynucleobacter paneuropaeus]QWD32449.1 cytochrome c [Polynucleobacter paneuropaeus]
MGDKLFWKNISYVASLFCLITACSSSYPTRGSTGLGKPISEERIQAWNIDINPSGQGLPSGSGSVIAGEVVFQQQCASCHGAQGQGGVANRLVGGGGLNTANPVKTVGSFWPYATTIFDYTRRAMPHNAPQSLSNDQLYAVTAYILFLNNIIAKDDVMNARSLPLVKMPNKDGFIPVEH